MNLHTGLAPHYRRSDSLRSMMLDVLVPLMFLLILPVIYNGFRPLIMALVTAAVCIFAEIVCSLFARKEINVTELSSVVTGIIIAMLMPVNAPMWLPCVAGVFAIAIVKMPFGGTGHTPFNPAAAGVAFVILSWPQLMFSFRNPQDITPLPLFGNVEVPFSPSSAALMHQGARPSSDPSIMLLGKVAGPLGTTAIAVLLACLLYLLFRRVARWETPVCFLAAAALFAAIFPRISGSRLESVSYELLAGSLVFAAVFMITEPSTAPKTSVARCLYGALGGIIAMCFRTFGVYEEGVVFAILLINTLQPALDRLSLKLIVSGGEQRGK